MRVVAGCLVTVHTVHPMLRAVVDRLRGSALGVTDATSDRGNLIVVAGRHGMATHAGVTFVDGVIIVRVGQLGDFDVLAIPPIVTATAVFPPGDRVRDVGSQHPCSAMAHAAVSVLVLGMVSGQQWSVLFARAVAGHAILVGYVVLFLGMRHRRLGTDSQPPQ